MLATVNPTEPKVAILLCTFHGEKYLSEQLDSIAAQTHGNWEIWASDDGSSDATHQILLKYQAGELFPALRPRIDINRT